MQLTTAGLEYLDGSGDAMRLLDERGLLDVVRAFSHRFPRTGLRVLVWSFPYRVTR